MRCWSGSVQDSQVRREVEEGEGSAGAPQHGPSRRGTHHLHLLPRRLFFHPRAALMTTSLRSSSPGDKCKDGGEGRADAAWVRGEDSDNA